MEPWSRPLQTTGCRRDVIGFKRDIHGLIDHPRIKVVLRDVERVEELEEFIADVFFGRSRLTVISPVSGLCST